MQPAYFELRLRRGDDFVQAFRLEDQETGDGIALSEFPEMDLIIKPAAGTVGAPAIAAALAGSTTVTGITKIAAASIGNEEGWFQVCIRKATLDGVPGTTDVVRMAWNLRLTDADGFETTFAHGPCEILPEVTYG